MNGLTSRRHSDAAITARFGESVVRSNAYLVAAADLNVNQLTPSFTPMAVATGSNTVLMTAVGVAGSGGPFSRPSGGGLFCCSI